MHHHFQEPWTNTNYGDILSIWDRMFGTYQSVSTHQELQFGLDSFSEKQETEEFWKLIKIPFGKYRPKPQ